MPWQHKGRVPSTAAHPPDTLTYSVEEVFTVTGCRGAKMSSSSLRGIFRARPGVLTSVSPQQPALSSSQHAVTGPWGSWMPRRTWECLGGSEGV